MATIVLAEDHKILREGLKALLHAVSDFEVIAETDDGLEAIAQVEQKRPDILITDLSIPGINGLELVRRTRKVSPKTGIVVLSMHTEEEHVVRAIRNGALAYVLKSEGMEDLEMAIRCVLQGRRFLSSTLRLDVDVVGKQSDVEQFEFPYDSLTNREREILQLVAEGFTSPQISERLFISLKTVNKHRSNLMDKLDRHSQTELVHFAIQRGLIPIGRKPQAGKNERHD